MTGGSHGMVESSYGNSSAENTLGADSCFAWEVDELGLSPAVLIDLLEHLVENGKCKSQLS
jgi:hypothetical protein